MESQFISRSLINGALGAAQQAVADRVANPGAAQAISAGVVTGAGAALKLWQIFGSRGRRRPFLDLAADSLLGSGSTFGGQVLASMVDARVLPAQTTTPPGATDTPPDAADATTTGAADQETYQYGEGSVEDVA